MTGTNRDATDSFSFDGLVNRYDQTRTVDQQCFDGALEFLVERFPPQQYASVVEPGVGTGRIACPLAERGYRVTGLDISIEMLAQLRQQINERGQSQLSCLQADVTSLPFSADAFDLAITVHLFYFVGQWRRAVNELFRVLTEHGTHVLMHTGFGRSIPSLNDRYKQLCAQRGHPIDTPGVESSQAVVDYASQCGYAIEQIRDRWTWTTPVTLYTALQNLQARAYSFTTIVPDDVHTAVLQELRSHILKEYGSLDTTVDVSNQLYMILISHQ